EAYASGLLVYPDAPVAVPRCLHTRRVSADRCWLWLEEMVGSSGRAWTPERWLEVAADVGAYQGHLAGARIEPREWFCRPFAESSAPGYRAALLDVFDRPETWAEPLVSRHVTPELVARARDLWGRRQELLARRAEVARTLCNWDLS